MSTSKINGAGDWHTRVTGDGFEAEVLVSPFNQRLQVTSYTGPKLPEMIQALTEESSERGFGKVFLKATPADQPILEDAGMIAEASIKGYFGVDEPAVVMSAFPNEERKQQPVLAQQEEILEAITVRPPDASVPTLPAGYEMAVAEPADAEDLAAVYQEVFESYPFPITSPRYLVETMASHVVYRVVRDESGAMVAAASGEMNLEYQNAEMTDFATLPSQRGAGLAQHLLAALEGDMEEREIRQLYTIARARSAGMNRVFYNRDYELTGTLVNNCHIAGRFEDMHVWCR